MITASLAWPRNDDAIAVTASRSNSGERNWLSSTGSARARYERTALGPASCSLRAASASRLAARELDHVRSGTMSIAPHGHSAAQIPQPLQ